MMLHSEPRGHQAAPGGLFSLRQTSRWQFIFLSTCYSAAASEPQAEKCIFFLHSIPFSLLSPAAAIEVGLIILLSSTSVRRSTGRRKKSLFLTYGERNPAVFVAVHTAYCLCYFPQFPKRTRVTALSVGQKRGAHALWALAPSKASLGNQIKPNYRHCHHYCSLSVC